ncbi:MAG: hypothetical protein MMC23_005065 [Stictis urceolatum]|nr:hypothetical protein [Stictis urceolata]
MYRHLDPIFGLDKFFRQGQAILKHRYLEYLWDLHDKYGYTFQSIAFGDMAISSVDPDNLKAVFTNGRDWGVGPVRLKTLDPFCGHGFITTDGPEWEHARSLLKPSFVKSNITNFSTIEQCLQLMLKQIPRDGTTVDLAPLFMSLYLDAGTAFILGESLGSLSSNPPEHAANLLDTFNETFQSAGLRLALGPFARLLSNKAYLAACKRTHAFADVYVDKALEYRKKYLSEKQDPDRKAHPIMLYNMAELTDDRINLRNQILQAIAAAQETTGCLLGSLFHVLARHPEVWNKLRDEALALETLDYDSLIKMKYFKNVFNETLRLYPVFPQLSRTALRPTRLPTGGGLDGTQPINCPAGTQFDASFYVLHRLPSIWGTDADVFRPERWDEIKVPSWAFAPFAGGSRVCLGQEKAKGEVAYVVARMLREFGRVEGRIGEEEARVEGEERGVWRGDVQLTAKNLWGCRVGLWGVEGEKEG